jgi:LIVCS family branched-chain amino acid:cation transporter
MSRYKVAFTAGLAMFAMFFGSGNLVFPLMIGAKTTDQFLTASLGLMITGVLVPFLGLFSMILYQGNKDQYFGLLGKWAPFTLSFLILSLIGPFGVIPRCILVSFGGINVIYPHIPLYLFSAIFLILIYFIILQKNKVVPIIGKYIGPLKIGGIILIIIAAIKQSPALVPTQMAESSFILGITQGYQTMDLMAAFFFSITIIEYLRSVCASKEETIKTSIIASSIGGSLIALVYLGFVYLGAHYAPHLLNSKPEQYLTVIASLTLGKHAALIVAVTIILSCLATASSLVNLFSNFLRTDISANKISWPFAVIVTICISFALSLTGFATIFNLLATILTYVYPALITLTLTAILHQYYNFKWTKLFFWITLITNGCYSLFLS